LHLELADAHGTAQVSTDATADAIFLKLAFMDGFELRWRNDATAEHRYPA
jgi:hypothetical protein